jgi:hypothetical protein
VRGPDAGTLLPGAQSEQAPAPLQKRPCPQGVLVDAEPCEHCALEHRSVVQGLSSSQSATDRHCTQALAPLHTLPWAQGVPEGAGALSQTSIVQVSIVHGVSSSQSASAVQAGGTQVPVELQAPPWPQVSPVDAEPWAQLPLEQRSEVHGLSSWHCAGETQSTQCFAPSQKSPWPHAVPEAVAPLLQRPLEQASVVHGLSSSQSSLTAHCGGAQIGVRRVASARLPLSHHATRSQPSRVEKFTRKMSGWLPGAKSLGCPWFLGNGTKKLSAPIGTRTLRELVLV